LSRSRRRTASWEHGAGAGTRCGIADSITGCGGANSTSRLRGHRDGVHRADRRGVFHRRHQRIGRRRCRRSCRSDERGCDRRGCHGRGSGADHDRGADHDDRAADDRAADDGAADHGGSHHDAGFQRRAGGSDRPTAPGGGWSERQRDRTDPAAVAAARILAVRGRRRVRPDDQAGRDGLREVHGAASGWQG
jgi:hypothetical protein